MLAVWEMLPGAEAEPAATEGEGAPAEPASPALRALAYAEQVALLAPPAVLAQGAPEAAPTPAQPDRGVAPVPQLGASAEAAGAEAVAALARPTLRWGSKGEDVVKLQSLLNHTDEVTTSLAVDGLFGPMTHKAVIEFQRAHPPLGVDGVVGPQTWGVLGVTPLEAQDPVPVAKKIFQRGVAAYKQGDFAHAYDFFSSADEHAHYPELTFNRAQCLRRLGARRAEAIALYEQYIGEGGKRSPEAVGHVAELRGPGRSGDDTTDTASAKALFDNGAALYGAGDYAHAYEEFSKADEAKHYSEFTFNRAQCLRRLGGRREEAIGLYEAYVGEGGKRSAEALAHVQDLRGPGSSGEDTVDTARAKALFTEGAAQYKAGDFAHAHDSFTKADEAKHYSEFTFNRAQCLRRLGGRREEAIALYGQYVGEGGKRSSEASFYLHELATQGAIDTEARL